MKETVLLTGYTDFISDAFLVSAFPEAHIVITGNTEMKTSYKNHIVVYHNEMGEKLWRRIFKMYDIDKIVYFSYSAAPFSEMPGDELGMLASLFPHCTADMRMVYVMGMQHPESNPIAVLEKSAIDMCARASWQTAGVNVIVSPWIYDMKAMQPALMQMFDEGRHELNYNAEQDFSFLASEDLSLLLFRMFDDWERTVEPYFIPNAFVNSGRVFSSIIMAESNELDIEFDFNEREPFHLPMEHTGKLRSRFVWFPVYSIFEDLPEMIRLYRLRTQNKESWFDKFFQNKNILLHILELIFGFIVTELLMKLCGVVSQFQMIDFRLLYVVVFGTMYNMRMGLGAAALASVSLTYAYYTEGINWITLFYEPTNWLPFIAFFTVGAVCGYIRSRDREMLESSENENQSLTERYQYLSTLNEDILQEKREYKSQIISSRDSFGKIFNITRQLDHDHPKNLLENAITIIESVMGNHSVAVYSCTGGVPYGRLAISSRDLQLPGSAKMQPLYDCLTAINKGEVWVNRGLDESLPHYMYAIWNEDKIDAIILLQKVAFNQMSLYFENLFKVLCGLISSSLLRANAYQDAIHQSRCVEGTVNILKESAFMEELKYAVEAVEHKFATHLLLHLQMEGENLSEKEVAISSCVRKTDIVGFYGNELYVLLSQATEAEMPIIGQRFNNANIQVEVIPHEQQRDMLLIEEEKQ